jgi:hypothetical protein
MLLSSDVLMCLFGAQVEASAAYWPETPKYPRSRAGTSYDNGAETLAAEYPMMEFDFWTHSASALTVIPWHR